MRFDIRDGLVDVRSSYLIEMGATNTARLTNGVVAVRSLKFESTGNVAITWSESFRAVVNESLTTRVLKEYERATDRRACALENER